MKKFWKKYKNWIVGVWGVGTTILSLYWAIYPLDQNARMTFYQESKVDFSAIDQPINEVQIVINGRNIREQNLNLKVYKFKTINDGKRDIKESDYASDVILGLHAKGGQIARINFLRPKKGAHHFLKGFNQDSSTAIFNKVFFRKGESIAYEVWVTHNKNTDPILSPIGKIADTQIVLTDKTTSGLTLGERLLEAGEGILNMFLMLALMLALIFAIAFPITLIRKILKTHHIKSKLDVEYDPSNKAQRGIIKLYLTNRKSRIVNILELFSDQAKMNSIYSESKAIDKDMDMIAERYPTDNFEFKYNYISKDLDAIEEVIKMGFAEPVSDSALKLNSEFSRQVTLTLRLLKPPND